MSKKKTIAMIVGCATVMSAVAMPVALNAADVESVTTKLLVQDNVADKPVSGVALTVKCTDEAFNKTVTTGENGQSEDVVLDHHCEYKVTSEKPEGFLSGVNQTITYSAETTPEAITPFTLEVDENAGGEQEKPGDKKEMREVKLKHVDKTDASKLIEGGKGQLLNFETKEVVLSDVDLKSGEVSIGELEVGKSYAFEWLESAKGFKPTVDSQEFIVNKEEGAQTVTLTSTASTGDTNKDEKPEVVAKDLYIELQDGTSKKALTDGIATIKETKSGKTFTLDFAKEKTLTNRVNSGEEYVLAFDKLPTGYEAPSNGEMKVKITDSEEALQSHIIYLVKSGSAGTGGNNTNTNTGTGNGGTKLPSTGAVATSAGVAGLTALGAFFARRKMR